MSEIRKLEKEYLKVNPQQYFLLTSISVNKLCKLKRSTINDCIITFRPSPPKNCIKEIQTKILRPASNFVSGDLPSNYICAKISIKGKSTSEAADKALDAIDTLRGIWNLFYNRRNTFRISSGDKKPVNKIVIGPLHTLHFQNGKLATETWWYEPSYRGPLQVHDPSKDIKNLYKFEQNVRKLLKKSNYRNFLETSLARYTRALDLGDWENAYLKLWGLLESLTSTGEKDSHKVTVKRTSFLFRERHYAKQVLTHLRDYRNKAVHVGAGNHDIETFMYQLKNFVEVVLEFQVANKFGFKSLAEVAQFMDLTDSKPMLERKIEIMNFASKYIEK